jgi:hypothetical protein
MKNLVVMLLITLVTLKMSAQESQVMVPLEAQVKHSNIIVEGKVLSISSYVDSTDGHIYTTNTIEVYKSFKGTPDALINITTRGGVVGLEAEIISSSTKLIVGDIGIFMVNKIENKMEIYSASQGFYKYDLVDNTTTNYMLGKDDITNIIDKLKSHTKTDYIELSDFKLKDINQLHKIANQKAILSFDKSTVVGGVQEIITITGSDFGELTGYVGFQYNGTHAESYVRAINSHILSWTDTEIKVEVPYSAGTGKIRVTKVDNNGAVVSSYISNDILTVTYSIINILYGGANGVNYDRPTQLYNDNGVNGYTITPQEDFYAHDGAINSLIRAMDNWRCNIGVNWVLDSPSLVNEVVKDDVNIVRFDIGDELPFGSLGETISYYLGCTNSEGDIVWNLVEFDITLDDDSGWYFGTGDTGIAWDFESVMLHELGHVIQLQHVRDESPYKLNGNDVMIYNIQVAEYQRVLHPNNILAGQAVMNKYTTNYSCNISPMISDFSGCTLSDNNPMLDYNKRVRIGKNPIQSELTIISGDYKLESIIIYDIHGRIVKSKTFNVNSSRYLINVETLPNGIYVVLVKTSESMLTFKVLKN